MDIGETYTYRVKAYKDSAASDYSNEASMLITGTGEVLSIPTHYSLAQNYPNPFNPSTKIEFSLPRATQATLSIYDLLGREVQTLLNKELAAGYHEITFDAINLPSGIYFCRMESGDFNQTKKMVLMK